MVKETPQPVSSPPVEGIETQDEMVEVSVSEASHPQLIWFCKQQGYEFSDAETLFQTQHRVKSAWEYPTITVPRVIVADEPPAKPLPPADYSSEERNGLPPFVKIKILSLGDEAKTEEHLALNGHAYRIQVGEIVSLPWYVYQGCILDAQQLRYRSDTEAGLGEPMISQAVAFTRIE